MDLSYADLGEAIGKKRGVVWIWLHSLNGFPHPKAFNEKHLLALAKVLKLDPAEIRTAIDASRQIYTQREPGPVPESLDALQTLIDVLRKTDRTTVRVSWVLNLAQRLQQGVPRPPAPQPQAPKVRHSRA
jgi:hypothetical protein